MIDVPGQERGEPLASDSTRSITNPNAGRRLTPALDPTIPAAIGRYRVDSLLGKGGMGQVYLAFDTRLDRQVAVKFLPQSSVGEQIAIDRFLREARAAAALNHPAICAIYSIEEYENIPFLVLEYIPGKTFRGLMDHPPQNWPPSPAEAAGYMLQAAEALKAAHKAGIVHRDIKCSNLMLMADGRVKILDFGLAKFTDAQLLTRMEPSSERPHTFPPNRPRAAPWTNAPTFGRWGSRFSRF
jgi:serine/threonine protein kinase